MLMSILYRSHAILGRESRAERSMLNTVRTLNRAAKITGHLHREEDVYYQWIEGPVAAIEALLIRLQGDPRHTDFSLLGRQITTHRQFADWSMGYSTSNEGDLLEWAIRNGFSLKVADPAQMVAFFHDQALRNEIRERPALYRHLRDAGSNTAAAIDHQQ